MPKFFLPLFTLLLFVLPLSNKLNYYSLPLLGFLLLFYGWVFWKQVRLSSSRALVFCFLFSLLVLLVGFMGHYQPPNWLEISRLIMVTWSIPVLIELVREHGPRKIAFVVVVVLALHAVWGAGQFVLQHDLGLSALGESRLSPQTAAVAKFNIGEHKLIRAYGPYSHSNSLSGALVVGVVLTMWLWLQRPSKLSEVVGVAMLGGLLITFSRAALVGLLLALVIFFIKKKAKLPRLFGVLVLITFCVFTPLYLFRASDPYDVAISQRQQGYVWAVQITEHLTRYRGAGIGQYEPALTSYLQVYGIGHQPWEVEPVHDVPLLLMTEWGVGSGMFLALLWYVRPRKPAILLWLLPLTPLLLFDHYIATQTAPLMWMMVLALVLSYGSPVVAAN